MVKHTNPCGVALADTIASAFERAYDCDPRSAYGGIVGLNRTLDEEVAARLAEHFLELVVVPDANGGARELLAGRPRLRLLTVAPGQGATDGGLEVRSLDGGILVQVRDPARDDETQFQVVSQRSPTDGEWNGLRLAWRIVRAVKSNAIVLCRDNRAVGIGAGQM